VALVSVLLPSRGRPDSLCRAVSSLAYGDVEIIVGLDEDDPSARDAEDLVSTFPGVRCCINPRQPTLGALFNLLALQADADWLVPFPDDYTIDQPNWAEITHQTLLTLPSKMGVAYLWDPLYPHFATFPIVSKDAIAMQGFYMPEFFQFLFGDTWWNEVGVMSGMILPSPASVAVKADTGNIHNYRNLKLWATLFEKTRPMRQDLAIRMIRKAMGDQSDADYLIATMEDRIESLKELQAPFMTDEFCNKWDGIGDGFPHPHYAALEAKTLAFMERM
jgi:hypothetical protein